MKGCVCGYTLDENSEGCGNVLEEWTKQNDEGEIGDTGWYHCGENGMFCDECQEKFVSSSAEEKK